MKDIDKLAKIFKALAHPNRLEIYLKIKNHHAVDLDRKRKRKCLLTPLCEHLQIGAPTLSHHLKELVNAGLVESERDGKFVICSLNEGVMDEIVEVFGK
jgi:ArsR family transcriptional regulator